MSSSVKPPFDEQSQGISLNELAEAFAQVMGAKPQSAGEAAADKAAPDLEGAATAAPDAQISAQADTSLEQPGASFDAPTEHDHCPLSPRTILEAMLFVGNRDNQPLTPARAAELMRDVSPDEIPALVDDLNGRYAARGAPYRIVGEGSGYRLALVRQFHGLRNRFFGRLREARLSQAAIDVLALVAYQQPITAEHISRMRSKPSNHILTHLVRRGLLRLERPEGKRRAPHYTTTHRFLRLFGLDSLDDLPRSSETGPP